MLTESESPSEDPLVSNVTACERRLGSGLICGIEIFAGAPPIQAAGEGVGAGVGAGIGEGPGVGAGVGAGVGVGVGFGIVGLGFGTGAGSGEGVGFGVACWEDPSADCMDLNPGAQF